jgi:hypothetical protein
MGAQKTDGNGVSWRGFVVVDAKGSVKKSKIIRTEREVNISKNSQQGQRPTWSVVTET